MGEINLSRREKNALAAVNRTDLDQRIDLAIRSERLGDLHFLPLDECGPYVSTNLSAFRHAFADHSRAKAPARRTQAADELQRAGHRLSSAVGQMQRRMEEEEKEGQFFHINDDVMHPLLLTDQLDVRITYRWRRTIDAEWTQGSIIFAHTVRRRPNFQSPVPKRKQSAAKREQDLKDERYKEWRDLMKTALYSLRDFFRSGGDGSTIPNTFRAVVDESGFLNNHSTRFWQKPTRV